MAYKTLAINASGNGDNTIITAVAGSFFRILNYVLVPAATVTIKFVDGGGAGTVLLGPVALTTQGLWPGWAPVLGAGFLWPWFDCSVGNALVLNLSAGTQTGGIVNYQQIAV